MLNTPGISRAPDFQRIVSYGVAVVLSLLIDLPARRADTALMIAAAMSSGAVWRLSRGTTRHPHYLAWTDQLVAGTAIALITVVMFSSTGESSFEALAYVLLLTVSGLIAFLIVRKAKAVSRRQLCVGEA